MTGRTSISTHAIKFAKQYAEPTFAIKKGKHWIDFGEDNLLPAYTESLITKSPDVQSIINGTIQYSIGYGLIPPTANATAMALFKNGEPNRANPNDLGTITAKAIRDLVVHGGACLRLTWNKEQTAIYDVEYVSISSMRIDSEYQGYWLCDDWKNHKKVVPEFTPSFSTDYGGTQLLYIKLPSAFGGPYSMPSFWACRTAIETQHGIARHYRNRTENSFLPNAIITFDDEPTEEEQDAIDKDFNIYHVGADSPNNGGIVKVFGTGVEIKPFTAGEGPKDFVNIQQTCDAMIISAFRIPDRGSIFGLARRENKGFGTREDILNEYELYMETVIVTIQNTILRVWNMLAEINGAGEGFQFQIEPYVLFKGDGMDPNSPGETTEKTDVAASALNGAQIDSLVSIITQVTAGTISPATALPLIAAAFPTIPADQITAMIAGASQANKPQEPQDPII